LPDSILLGIYVALTISQALLMFIAAYLAYRITRIIGTFWAWSLLVVAFGFFALANIESLASVLSTPAAQLTTRLGQFTITSLWPGTLIHQVGYTALMVATYGLNKIFKEKSRKDLRQEFLV
jgi:hypothetical protein